MISNLTNLKKCSSQNGDASKVFNATGSYWSEFIKAMILDFGRSFGTDSEAEFIANDPTRDPNANASEITSGIIGYAIFNEWLVNNKLVS